jgi:DNA-binding GntR family transcriptional regulator
MRLQFSVNSFQKAAVKTISPIKPQSSLTDQAFHKLAEAISRGDFEPGQAISEVQIAKQLGISRGPLREAMNRLEARNLVERRPRFGVQVVRLSQKDLAELFTMREALEGLACRLAATSMSDQEIAALSALLEEHGRSKGVRTGSDYYQGSANEDFHFRIVRGSGNTRLIKALCEDLYYQIRIYRYRSSVSPGRAHAAFDEHKAIVKALRARDPDRAEAAMRNHISHAQANLVLPDIQSIKKEMVRA